MKARMRLSPIQLHSRLLRQGAAGFAIVVVIVMGCRETPPPASSEKAPWLDVDKQIALLNEGDFRLRALAARNLGKLGADAAKAIPKLEALANDPNPKVREQARESLEKIRAATGGTP